MIRYLSLLMLYIPFYLFSLLVAPLLPAFASMRMGPLQNGNGSGVEPRLPRWLFWFDTSTDNSLWGDYGWRTNHCKRWWHGYLGMVLWLWRNPAAGFAWTVLAHPIGASETFTYTHSGNGLNVDKGAGRYGWYLIRSSEGAFSFRWCRKLGRKVLSFEAGWLLDVYLTDPTARARLPLATFQCQPQIRTAAT